MNAVVHFCYCAPLFSVFCCPRLSLRLHSLLTGMVSPPTYGSQCTPSLARASFAGVLSEALHFAQWKIRAVEKSRDFPCVLLCVVQIFKFLIWIWRFEFSIDEVSIVNFTQFQVKTFRPVPKMWAQLWDFLVSILEFWFLKPRNREITAPGGEKGGCLSRGHDDSDERARGFPTLKTITKKWNGPAQSMSWNVTLLRFRLLPSHAHPRRMNLGDKKTSPNFSGSLISLEAP